MIFLAQPNRSTKLFYLLLILTIAGLAGYNSLACGVAAYSFLLPSEPKICVAIEEIFSIRATQALFSLASGIFVFLLTSKVQITTHSPNRIQIIDTKKWYQRSIIWHASLAITTFIISIAGPHLYPIAERFNRVSTPFLEIELRDETSTAVTEIDFEAKRRTFEIEAIANTTIIRKRIQQDIEFLKISNHNPENFHSSLPARQSIEYNKKNKIISHKYFDMYFDLYLEPLLHCTSFAISNYHNQDDIQEAIRPIGTKARELLEFINIGPAQHFRHIEENIMIQNGAQYSSKDKKQIIQDNFWKFNQLIIKQSEYLSSLHPGSDKCHEQLNEELRYAEEINQLRGHAYELDEILNILSNEYFYIMTGYMIAFIGNFEGAIRVLESYSGEPVSRYVIEHQIYSMKYFAGRPYREIMPHTDRAIRVVDKQISILPVDFNSIDTKTMNSENSELQNVLKRLKFAKIILMSDFLNYSAITGENELRARYYAKTIFQLANNTTAEDVESTLLKTQLLDTAAFVEIAFERRRATPDQGNICTWLEQLHEAVLLLSTIDISDMEITSGFPRVLVSTRETLDAHRRFGQQAASTNCQWKSFNLKKSHPF